MHGARLVRVKQPLTLHLHNQQFPLREPPNVHVVATPAHAPLLEVVRNSFARFVVCIL